MIVSHLRSTGTCHTLKELEKTLPAVALINAMQVKEYIQELVDENAIRCEKIGSGNWYWCFGDDERRQRESQRAQVQREVDRMRARWEGVVGEVETRRRRLQEQAESSCAGGDREEAEGDERWVQQREAVEEECRRLRSSLQAWRTTTGTTVARMRRETEEFRAETRQWTENVYVLEAYLTRLAGGDQGLVRAVQEECYGEEYDEEEGGLPDIF